MKKNRESCIVIPNVMNKLIPGCQFGNYLVRSKIRIRDLQ